MKSNSNVKSFRKISNGIGGLPLGTIPLNGQFGTDLRNTNDIDGNGVADLIVGAVGNNGYNGANYIIGIDSSLNPTLISIIDQYDIPIVNSGVRFGRSVCHIGDIDNDGTIELASGATYYDGKRGEVIIYSMEPKYSVGIGGSKVVCQGHCDGIATANVVGGVPPFSYAWNTGATTSFIANLCTGFYNVTITDANGDTCSRDVSIKTQIPPVVSLGPDITITTNDTHFLSPGLGYYLCVFNGIYYTDSLSISGNDLGAGTFVYYIDVTDSTGCVGSDTIVITVTLYNGINAGESIGDRNIKIIPNPNSGKFVLELSIIESESDYVLKLFNSQGQLVIQQEIDFENGIVSFDYGNLISGAYYIRIEADGCVMNSKLVIIK